MEVPNSGQSSPDTSTREESNRLSHLWAQPLPVGSGTGDFGGGGSGSGSSGGGDGSGGGDLDLSRENKALREENAALRTRIATLEQTAYSMLERVDLLQNLALLSVTAAATTEAERQGARAEAPAAG